MEIFEYPIDTKTLIRKKAKIKKELLSSKESFIEKKIAILGGSTVDEIADQLELFLLSEGIKPSFYKSEYAQFWQDAVFGNEELDSFAPDIIYFHTSFRNITSLPLPSDTKEEVDRKLQSEFEHFKKAWDSAAGRYKCPIIQDNFDRPSYRLLGNSDISDYRGKTNFVCRLNMLMYDYANSNESFYVNDVDYLAACFGLDAWQNPLFWHMYKYSLCLDAIPHLAKSVCDIIKSIYGKNKKVLVCDLDNTLWGGVIGDDGVEKIQIGPEVSMGQIYSEFQSYIKELRSIGVLLAVDSKNDEENALAGLRHPDSKLSPEDFSSIKANWENKDRNMKSIAAELSLGIDSFVFIDDNPAEREIIKQSLPEVAVPAMDRVENYLRNIDKSGFFEITSISGDDLRRADMYKANAKRTELMESAGNYDDFLKSLEMKAIIKDFEPIYISRISQLTNKSNQFNLTTLRCSESDIEKMKESNSFITLYGKLEDKFGDNGVVSVVAGEKEGTALHIRLWLMSCRVLKRGMEDAMLDTLVSRAAESGITEIIGYYFPTAKNGMVKDFFQRMGFKKISEAEDGSAISKLSVSDYTPKKPHIQIN